jgi:hypothetical protein
MSQSTISSLAEFFLVDTRSSRGKFLLPEATSSLGRKVTILDAYGTFSNSTLQVLCSTIDRFEDGESGRFFSTNNARITFIAASSIWYVLQSNVNVAGFNSSNLFYNLNSSPYTLDINSVANISTFNTVNLGTQVAQCNMWVAAGRGANRLKYSLDNGITWSNCTENFTSVANSVAYNGKMWVAVGQGANNIQYSYNGITWSNVTNNFPSGGQDVRWNGQMWVASGDGYPPTVNLKWSLDGVNWNDSLTNAINYNNNGAAAIYIAWNGYVWVVGSAWPQGDGNGTVYSYDGKNWNYNSPTSRGYGSFFTTWTGEVFTLFDDAYVYYTSNGVDWFTDSNWPAANGAPTRIATDGNILVTVGSVNFSTIHYGYTYGQYIKTNFGFAANSTFHSVEFGNGRFIAVGSNSASMGNNIVYSDDGLNWTTVTGFDNEAKGIAFSSNQNPNFQQSNFTFLNGKFLQNLNSTNQIYCQPSTIVLNNALRVDSQTSNVHIGTNGGTSNFVWDVNGTMRHSIFYSTVTVGGTTTITPGNGFGVHYDIQTAGTYTISLSNTNNTSNIGKFYVFQNNTSGALSVTISGGSGISSPLSIPRYTAARIMVASATTYALF